MKIGQWARLMLAAAPLLAGCKGFWDAPASTGTGTGTASGVFYVLNQKTSQIAGYSFAASTTTPTVVTGSPYALGTGPLCMAISANGGFLYVSTGGGIFVYSIGTGGALTLLNGNAAISADTPTAMVVDPNGYWLVESISGSGTLSAVPLDPTTGLLETGSKEVPIALPNVQLTQIAISPSGSTNPYVFVGMGSGGTAVIPFTYTATAPFGTVGTISVKGGASGAANAVAVDPSNRLLYIGETVAATGTQTGGLRAFTIGASSVMTELTGTSYPY